MALDGHQIKVLTNIHIRRRLHRQHQRRGLDNAGFRLLIHLPVACQSSLQHRVHRRLIAEQQGAVAIQRLTEGDGERLTPIEQILGTKPDPMPSAQRLAGQHPLRVAHLVALEDVVKVKRRGFITVHIGQRLGVNTGGGASQHALIERTLAVHQ